MQSIDGCSNSIANALELLQSCTLPPICDSKNTRTLFVLVSDRYWSVWSASAPGLSYDHPGATESTLTTFSPDKMAVISKMIFSNTFCGITTFEFQILFHWNVFFRVMTIIGSYNGSAPNGRQAIIWTNHGLVYWCIYASLCLNQLIIRNIDHTNPIEVENITQTQQSTIKQCA